MEKENCEVTMGWSTYIDVPKQDEWVNTLREKDAQLNRLGSADF